MYGVMRGNMKDCGKITRCTGRGSSHGPTVESIKESTILTRSRERESSNGLMADPTTANGKMASKMGRVFINLK